MSNPYEKSTAEHLYENRIVYLSGDINTPAAEPVIQRLLILDCLDHEAEIKLYISSFGGSVFAGLGIYDAMQTIEAPVSTVCLGIAASMAAWLLAAGEPGRRFATPNARIMIHQGSMQAAGSTSDMKIAVQQLIENERLMNEILARHCGRPAEEMAELVARDLWLTPQGAIDLGLIDGVAPHHARKCRSQQPAAAAAAAVPMLVPSR